MVLNKHNLSAIILLGIVISGCKTTAVIAPDQSKPQYSIIYLIHGDADYLYFDENGKDIRADQKVLREAQLISEKMVNGEVFIFHQRRERKWLWLIPKKDRQMWYYRNGKLLESQSYSPLKEGVSFSAESALYNKYAHTTKSTENYLFYFGHQIPRLEGRGYDHSRSAVELNAVSVTEGLKKFLPGDSAKFELIVLSTCNNGTPTMVNMLEPIAQVLLASPQNLHLSHIDTQAISSLENEPSVNAKAIADAMAQDTFQRLSASIQTEISLSVFELGMINLDEAQSYVSYSNYLSNTEQKAPFDNIDCASLNFFSDFKNSTGVNVWYRPAQFGRKATVKSHSGWGCELREPRTGNSSITINKVN